MRRSRAAALAVALTLSGPGAVLAQEDDAAAASDAGDAGDSELEASDAAAARSSAATANAAWRIAASPAEQEQARRLFYEGNELVKESLFVQAVEKYEAALTHWDHPGIHYNLALALINLDQPVRLRAHLLESLKFGAEALGADKARRAKQYIALVEKQLTEIEIRSTHTGARVELDGELVFVAPGEYRAFVRPGRHTLKAVAPGYETSERTLALVAGERTEVAVRLYKPEEWIRKERRWHRWGPITLTGAGTAVVSVGATLYAVGALRVRDYDAEVDNQCGLDGCTAGELSTSEQTGRDLQAGGVATLVVGGAALATGGVLLFLNRPVPHRVDPEARAQVSFTPLVGPGALGVRGVF